MKPSAHIIYGFLFITILNYPFPYLGIVNFMAIWFGSVFIDFDHYLSYAFKSGIWNPFVSIKHHTELVEKLKVDRANGIREAEPLNLFHTVEFIFLVSLAGQFIHPIFNYIFIGMVFHLLLDMFWMWKNDFLYRRNFFFFKWLAERP